VTHLDAGLVESGQRAKLKLTAYPFQQYGMLDARVGHVSPDASEPAEQKNGRNAGIQDQPASGFRTLIELPQTSIEAQGKRFRLSPGMQVNAEINLGTRTVLQYFLSPYKRPCTKRGANGSW